MVRIGPATPEPQPRPNKITRQEYNSWRTHYTLSFDTETEAINAYNKVLSIGDFDKAADWLDKQ
jgi:hypothetical protein